jgi:hypothetical protein
VVRPAPWGIVVLRSNLGVMRDPAGPRLSLTEWVVLWRREAISATLRFLDALEG